MIRNSRCTLWPEEVVPGMEGYLHRMMEGPGAKRLIIQPTMAIVIGVWHGLRDARAQRPPFIAGLIAARGHRSEWLTGGLRAIAWPIALALTASVVFQYLVMSHVHLLYALGYAAIFVALPYFVARSLADRAASRSQRGQHA
jgi:hypothetical protein